MSKEIIKKVLASGLCPNCNGDLGTIYRETLTIFQCQLDETHFKLEVSFHDGEKITASLNGVNVPDDELAEIDW